MKNVPEWKDKEAQTAELERCASHAGAPDSNGANWLNRDAPGLKRDADAGHAVSTAAEQPAD